MCNDINLTKPAEHGYSSVLMQYHAMNFVQ